jgi:hypothetical protein
MRQWGARGPVASRCRTVRGHDMGRGSLLMGLPLCGLALVGGCAASEVVLLGNNVDAGVAARAGSQDAAPAPDAPTPDPQEADAPDAAPGLCPRNPTFLGVPTTGLGITRGTSPNLPDWQVCSGSVDVNPGICTLLAPSGSTTYLGLPVGYAVLQHAISTSISTSLPTTLEPGSYSFSLQLGVAVSTLPRGGFGVAGGAPVELVFYGSSSPCGQDQELGRTTLITNHDSWASYSVTLTARQPFSNLVLVPTLTNPLGSPGQAGAYVVVAQFASASCY